MMKAIGKSILSMALLALATTPVWAAANYSEMSPEELSKIRRTLQNSSQEDRDALRSEWQSRLQAMTAEERQQYLGNRSGGAGDGSGMGQGRGKGNGQGRQAQ